MSQFSATQGSNGRFRGGRRLLFALAVVALASSTVIVAASASARAKPTSMTFLISDFSADLDPDGVGTVSQAQINANVNDRLFYFPTKLVNGEYIPNYNADPGKYTPHLATSWKQTSPTTWVFTLRKGVKGCTGNQMTADDVVYTFSMFKSRTGINNAGFNNWAGFGLWSSTDTSKTIDGAVKKLGTYKVEFKLAHPNSLFAMGLTDSSYGGIYDSKLLKAHSTSSDPWGHKWLQAGHSAGFGPYCAASVDPNAQQFVLKANRGWYRKVQFTTVTVRAQSDPASRFAAVQARAADGTVDLAPDQYASLQKSASVYSVPDSNVIWLGFNYKVAPWSLPGNTALRLAVAAAIPYKTIVQTLTGAGGRLRTIVPPSYLGAVNFPLPQQNLKVAAQELAKAGYPNGQGLDKYSDGLTVYYPSYAGAYVPAMLNQIRTSLAQIGMHISVQPLDGNTFTVRNFVKHDLPMMTMVLNPGNTPDAGAAVQLFFASAANGGYANFTNYSSSNLNSLASSYASGTLAQHRAAVKQMQQQLWGDFPVIPLTRLKSQIVFKKGIWGEELRTVMEDPTFWTLRTK